jgi:hypothetical protein
MISRRVLRDRIRMPHLRLCTIVYENQIRVFRMPTNVSRHKRTRRIDVQSFAAGEPERRPRQLGRHAVLAHRCGHFRVDQGDRRRRQMIVEKRSLPLCRAELFETVMPLPSSPNRPMLEHRSPETIPPKLLPPDRFRRSSLRNDLLMTLIVTWRARLTSSCQSLLNMNSLLPAWIRLSAQTRSNVSPNGG